MRFTRLRRIALIVSLTGGAAPTLAAAPAPVWTPWDVALERARFTTSNSEILSQHIFGGAKVDWLTGLAELRDGNVVGVGFINRDDQDPQPAWDATAVKLTPSGELVWARQLGGERLDSLWGVEEDARGRILVVGFTSSRGSGHWDGYFAALSQDGAVLFERTFGGPKEERLVDLAPTADGGYLLVGQSDSSGAGGRDVYLVKTDATGTRVWERTYGGPGLDRGFAIVRSGDGYVISGTTSKQADGATDGLVMKVGEDGEMVWRQVLAGEQDDTPHSMNLGPKGEVVVTGYTQSWGARERDFFAATYSPSGELLRHEIFGGPGDDREIMSVTDRDGGTLLIGFSTSCGRPDYDILVARISPAGSFDPMPLCVAADGADFGTTILPARDGTLLLGGYTESFGAGASDAFIMRLKRPASAAAHGDFSVRSIR